MISQLRHLIHLPSISRAVSSLVFLGLLASSPQAQAQTRKEAGPAGQKAKPAAKNDQPAAQPAKPACPIAPMQLVSVDLDGEGKPKQVKSLLGRPPAMTLEADGRLVIPLFSLSSIPKTAPYLDPRGCMIGENGVWVDQTKSGKLWTQRQEIATMNCGLQMQKERWLIIDEEGYVRPTTKPGTREQTTEIPTLRFLGYVPGACCAARIMLAGFLSMMPSMAVSDGNPAVLPPPKDPACPEAHKQ